MSDVKTENIIREMPGKFLENSMYLAIVERNKNYCFPPFFS